MTHPIPAFDPRVAFRLDGTVCVVTGELVDPDINSELNLRDRRENASPTGGGGGLGSDTG